MKYTGFITAADLTNDDYFYITVKIDRELYRPSVTMGDLVLIKTLATRSDKDNPIEKKP